MARIEHLVAELNTLCKQYVEQKVEFKEKERLRELILQIEMLGYKISIPGMDMDLPDYDLLSDEGKKDFERMKEIRKKKFEAAEKKEFERAADLRDLERQLTAKIQNDFCAGREDRHFILAGKMSELVMFNDPGNCLLLLIKSPDK
jgi:hypothetical protein